MARVDDRTYPKDGFQWEGNHPLLDFINTEVMHGGVLTDLLGNPGALNAWLGHAGLRTGWPKGGQERLLKRALALRATMRRMVTALAKGKPVPGSALKALNALLAERRGHVTLRRQEEGFIHVFSISEVDPLANLFEAASDLLCRQDLSLVRRCGGESCVLFFLDTTRNHGRRWCSMTSCGNRSKVAAHHRRRKAKG